MSIVSAHSVDPLSVKAIARWYYLDVAQVLFKPGSFFEAMPAVKTRRDALIFLGLTAMIYSLPVIFLTTAQRSMFMILYLVNALLVPVATAFVLYLLLRFINPGRYSYDLLFCVAAYANVFLLLGWIPGLAPWAEIWKYALIGLGLVKSGGISGIRAFSIIVATAFLLIMIVYLLQFLMGF